MFALILAVVSLSGIDPDPVVTPAPGLHGRLPVASGFAPGLLPADSGLTADVTVAPACSYGVPQFGSGLWNGASALTRTLAMPACPMGDRWQAFSAPGAIPPGFVSPWLMTPAGGLVRFEPIGSGLPGSASGSFHPAAFPATNFPARIVTRREPALRAAAPSPVLGPARSMPVAAPGLRRH